MHNRQYPKLCHGHMVMAVTAGHNRPMVGMFLACVAVVTALAVPAQSESRLSMPEQSFLRVCWTAFDPRLPRESQADGERWLHCLSGEMEAGMTVYFEAILNKKYYDDVCTLLLQNSHVPFIERPVMLKPFTATFMFGKPELAVRYPMAERMAFMRLVLSTSNPFDRGAYHTVAKGKPEGLGALREWVKANGSLDGPLSQEAVRVLAEVDIAAFLKEVCNDAIAYQVDSADAANEQYALAQKQLNSSERLESLAGLGRLFKLECDQPGLDLETLWNTAALNNSPLRPWFRENRALWLATQDYGWRKAEDRPGQTRIPGQLLEAIYHCDAWYSLDQYIAPSLDSVSDALVLAKGASEAQFLATCAVWRIYLRGMDDRNISSEAIQPLAHLADTYVQKFKDNKVLLPACLILYFPFLRVRPGFESEHQAAWDLYTHVVQSDSPEMRCRALLCLATKEGHMQTPEGDMVRKAAELEMQDAIKDGDLCHMIAATAVAERTGLTDSMFPMGPTVP